ncbi:MAG: hypothetical protein IIB83_02335 [Bacteroidetes bacterium]|nr:hypothetical protein [Bacteroidota bacterium]
MKLFCKYALLIFVIQIFFSPFLHSQNKKNKYHFTKEKHLKNIRMLTIGGENAEAYLSFDDKKLIYQSSYGKYKCDQIFTMNLDGTNKTLVSTGKGKTTCAYFLPGDSTIIYSSTHLADENCPPPPDRSHGYVWKLYETFDIFSANTDGSDIKQLTFTNDYDAEGRSINFVMPYHPSMDGNIKQKF